MTARRCDRPDRQVGAEAFLNMAEEGIDLTSGITLRFHFVTCEDGAHGRGAPRSTADIVRTST